MKIWPIALVTGLVVGWAAATDIQFTPGERATWEQLMRRVAYTTPTHRLGLRDGREFAGWPLSVTTNVVRWAAPLGVDGRLMAEFECAQVDRIAVLLPPPSVNYCDVSFQLEFPDLRLIRRPPYSLLTDEPATCAARYLDALEKLHATFRARFGGLTEGLGLPDHVQVLIFSEEAAFHAHQRCRMGRAPVKDGFYTPAPLRLTLFDQRHASGLQEALKYLAFGSEKRQVRAASDVEANAIRLHDLAQACEFLREAERANQRILRHEGAHQLFHASGILIEGVTSGWLAEGLALWCESREFGAVEPVYAGRIKTALEQQCLIPLTELVGHRDQGGQGFFAGDRRVDLAYAESWSLVRLLMCPADQPGFFNYLRHLRSLDAITDIQRTPPLELLCRFLQLTPAELDARWSASLKRLPFDAD
ncbi:MAG: hypothetical protein EPN23_02175 [Verrucomicrobia bacterium]|nr:MAG: hypothetical protein EPN23_02175 [Verrucomicrobiota bacterium]